MSNHPKAAPIESHQGSKYLRKIRAANGTGETIWVDVYAVIECFAVTCPGRQQSIKKLLCAGVRGKGSQMDDLWGAHAALQRAIQLQEEREVDGASGETH